MSLKGLFMLIFPNNIIPGIIFDEYIVEACQGLFFLVGKVLKKRYIFQKNENIIVDQTFSPA